VQPVCIGQGVDAFTDGVFATVIVPSAIGLLLWVRELRLACMLIDTIVFRVGAVRHLATAVSAIVRLARVVHPA
jgi:hypothetical protein